MLELLRKSGNPHCQIHNEEDMEVMPNASNGKFNDEISRRTSTEVDSDDETDAQDSDDDEEMRNEVEYITKDPVRKY